MHSTSHELLNDFPVAVSFPLHWGDQDAFGHVNNTLYLRWAESARIEYLSRIGVWSPSAELAVGPILAAIHCNFRIPLTYPDTVYAASRVTRIGNTSFEMVHRIVSVRHNAVAADLESTLVLYDCTTGKPVPVPAEIREVIARVEQSAQPNAR